MRSKLVVVAAFTFILPAMAGCAQMFSRQTRAPATDSSTEAADSTAPSSTAAATPTSAAVPEKPEVDITAPAGMPDLAALIGPRKDGWTPTLLVGFERKMTPEAAGKLMPGAEKINEFGIARVVRKDLPAGVKMMTFQYLDGDGDKKGKWGLTSIEVAFKPKQDAFYAYLIKVMSNKYGDAPPDDVAKKLVLWMNDNFASAGVQLVGEGYKLIWTPGH